MRELLVVVALLIAGCADDDGAGPEDTLGSGDGCADVVDVEASPDDDGTWRFETTVSSDDTGVDKYADLWVVRGPDGTTLGERVLTHPHEDEQPFTRSLAGVEIPDGIDRVEVAARDSVLGFCGATVTVSIEPAP